MPRPGEFPLRHNCRRDDPEEAFLWMFVALPGLNGAPLLMSQDYFRMVSKRLWDLGCRPVEDPTLEWVPPAGTDPNWITSPGRWVPAGTVPTPPLEEEAKQVLTKLTGQQKHELLHAVEVLNSPAGQAAARMTDEARAAMLEALRGEQ